MMKNISKTNMLRIRLFKEDLDNYDKIVRAIKAGFPIYYRLGYRYQGAMLNELSIKQALSILPQYKPKKGLKELILEEDYSGKKYLVLNEFTETDLSDEIY